METKNDKRGINVYSEIGKLREVLVHRPGREIDFLDPTRLDELLFAATLEANEARLEHDNFVNVLKDQGIKVIELADLVAQTYATSNKTVKDNFIEKFLNQATPELTKELRVKVKTFLISQKSYRAMVDYMMGGILSTDLKIMGQPHLIVEPMPNLYFTRDPFASVGNGVTMHWMKHNVRRREVLFSEFIFENNERFCDNVPKWITPTKGLNIEGGDVFIYNKETLVIGISNRTKMVTIKELAKNIMKNNECSFKWIYAVNVPDMPNLMHLDTWLTMVDYNKFLYSPNMLSVLKVWKFDLTTKKLDAPKELNVTLDKVLQMIIGKKPILIPVAGEGASQIDINIETNFDATNYLVLEPGVVVGYSRNVKTEAALKKAGITVLSFRGNQLSLGMGSARCMSMPLWRDDLKNN